MPQGGTCGASSRSSPGWTTRQSMSRGRTPLPHLHILLRS
jgi:hypothetical protein